MMVLRDSPPRNPREQQGRQSTGLTAPLGSVEANGLEPLEQEAYQRLAQSLRSFQLHQHRIILLASASHGEGTSTVARKLAATLTKTSQEPVLLVDANLRSPSQHEAFQTAQLPGFSEIASHSFKRLTGNGGQPGLFLLPCGDCSEGRPQLLADPALRKALNDWRAIFDWIILDGAPVTAYTDSAVLASLVDGVILVVQAEETRWEVAEQAKRILVDAGGQVLGCVLNRRQYHIPSSIYRRL